MIQWEYHQAQRDRPDDLYQELTLLGNAGWELVNVTFDADYRLWRGWLKKTKAAFCSAKPNASDVNGPPAR